MNTDDPSGEEDPLFGNSLSGLLGCALGTPLPHSGLRALADWVPPTPGHIAELLPQYRIEHFIGRGGMGAVYKGRQITLNRPVAIKVLPAELAKNVEFVARFHREAQLLASLSHQNIVTIFEFGQTGEGHLFFVMEYVEGMDLHRLIRHSPPDAPQALRITAQICEAMQYAHEMGVIHRDIKPANVLVTPDGRVKLVDFGLATKPADFVSEPQEPAPAEEFDPTDPQGLLARRFTRPGSAVGTPDYAAPEVYDGAADERSDIYALGIMLYEMLTGAPPSGYFPLPSTKAAVDERVDGVVVKALAVDPADRYQNAAEMKKAVEQATAPLPASPGPAARPLALSLATADSQPSQKATRRRSGKLADVIVAGFLVVGAGTAYDGVHHWRLAGTGYARAAALWTSLSGRRAPQVTATPSVPERKKIQRVEGEDMTVVTLTGGVALPQTDMRQFKAASWSGSAQLWWRGGRAGNSLTLRFNVDEAGKQRIRSLFTVSKDFGVVDVQLDDKRVAGAPFNLQWDDTTLAGTNDWGVFDLAAGDHELKLTLVGTHGESTGYGAYGMGLDYVQMEPPVVTVPDAKEGAEVSREAWPSASACWKIDNADAINCGFEPAEMRSGDRDLSRVAWFPRRGGMEWAQYEWMQPRKVNECRVFWFDDKDEPGGACALPAYWRVLYREPSGAWVPVDATFPLAEDDKWSVVKFPTVVTTAMRIQLQCQTDWSAGICRWKVLAAGPKAEVPPPARHDISLCDLPPLHAQVGWSLPHANLYDSEMDKKEGRVVWLGGKTCTHFLWAHARSYLEYAIPEGCTRFKATGIGPTDEAVRQPSWNGAFNFTVKADGQVLFDSEALNTYPAWEVPMDLPLPKGAKKLELITGPTINQTTWAHALWAYPTFCY